MTDGTQELDETLNVLYMQGEDIGKLEYGSATHQITAVNGAKQALLDWHNKQVEAVLNRLEAEMNRFTAEHDIPMRDEALSAIEAERNKLKESK